MTQRDTTPQLLEIRVEKEKSIAMVKSGVGQEPVRSENKGQSEKRMLGVETSLGCTF